MSTSDLFTALFQTKYFTKNPFTEEQYNLIVNCSLKLAESLTGQIFEGNQQIDTNILQEKFQKNFAWILTPYGGCRRIFEDAGVQVNEQVYKDIEKNFELRNWWIKENQKKK